MEELSHAELAELAVFALHELGERFEPATEIGDEVTAAMDACDVLWTRLGDSPWLTERAKAPEVAALTPRQGVDDARERPEARSRLVRDPLYRT